MPYAKNLARALTKPPKVFFFDNGEVQGSEGEIFENLVASHLLKRIHFLEDSISPSLLYFKNKLKIKNAFQLVGVGNRFFIVTM